MSLEQGALKVSAAAQAASKLESCRAPVESQRLNMTSPVTPDTGGNQGRADAQTPVPRIPSMLLQKSLKCRDMVPFVPTHLSEGATYAHVCREVGRCIDTAMLQWLLHTCTE